MLKKLLISGRKGRGNESIFGGQVRENNPAAGYRKLRSFQTAQTVYDATVIFCERFIDKFSRTRDQMVQAARSGVQNIAL